MHRAILDTHLEPGSERGTRASSLDAVGYSKYLTVLDFNFFTTLVFVITRRCWILKVFDSIGF